MSSTVDSKLWDYRGFEVLEGALPTNIGMINDNIPKIIHLTWKTEKFEGHRLKCIQSIRKYSKLDGIIIILWTDEDIKKLVSLKLNERQKKIYNWYPLMILKVDYIRVFFLYLYGGIYLDSDVLMKKQLVPNFPSYKADFYANHTKHHLIEGIQNAIMICRKNDDFALFYIEKMTELVEEINDPNYKSKPNASIKQPLLGRHTLRMSVLSMTGPLMLGHAMLRYNTSCTINNKKNCSVIKGLDEFKFHNVEDENETLELLKEKQNEGKAVLEHDGYGESWSHLWAEDLAELICIIVVGLVFVFLILILCSHYATKYYYMKHGFKKPVRKVKNYQL